MSAPDVAALLARHPMPWRVKLSFAIDANGDTVLDDQGYAPDPRQLFNALATALRAALADQRRLEWLDAQTMNVEYDGACPLPWSIFDVQIGRVKRSTLKGEGESLRAAIDAALTADGGVK